MSELRDDTVTDGKRSGAENEVGRERTRLSRRAWTVLCSGVLVVVFGLLGTFVRVPYVSLGPGPTYDMLGSADGTKLIRIDGQTFPTSGELRMTTVSLNDDVTLFGALGLWVSGRYALAPLEAYRKPGETDEEVKRENARQFRTSQSNAEVAALRSLGYPVKVMIKSVEPGSPADGELAPGQRLTEVNGKPVSDAQSVQDAVADTRPGDTIPVTVQGQDGQRRAELTLTDHPDPNQPQGFMGITPIDRADVGFEIDISLEHVGGPSAGLIFALGIVDRLTPGAMVEGEHIAGTGTISPTGVVGPIGGISFKVVAAREAGATAFLVPEDNCAEAAEAAPDGLRLVKVGTLDQAVHALGNLKADQPVPTCAAG